MAIPKYDEIMLPLLKILSDGQSHTKRELMEKMADHFNLAPEERALMLPATRVTYIKHRTGWAAFGLRKAGLATNPIEGTLVITEEGRKFLATNPSGRLTRSVLMQFEPFRQFTAELKERAAAAAKKGGAVPPAPSDGMTDDQITPEERMGSAFAELNATLVTELLSRLAQIDPFRFEQVVLDLLVKMGYGGSFKEAAAVTQKTGDEGIDGVINQDRLGLDVIYIQAKRWKQNVGRPEIQSFVGALAGRKANKGIFITTSSFHTNATEYAAGLHNKVILVDGCRLAELMIEHGLGVSEEHAYSVKKIDSDYFEET
ncbi:MAG TPA: restriction endonuclease [Chthoniobacterales bacterium]|jgi:restriction system protein|nr:restriction endonuclease [Chthoniobacterales bacterium]